MAGSTSICTRTALCSFTRLDHAARNADIDAAIGADEEAVAVHAADDAEGRRRRPQRSRPSRGLFFTECFGGFGGELSLGAETTTAASAHRAACRRLPRSATSGGEKGVGPSAASAASPVCAARELE